MFWLQTNTKTFHFNNTMATEKHYAPSPIKSYVTGMMQTLTNAAEYQDCLAGISNKYNNGQWFIVSCDSANKQKHHKSHRMQ